MFGVNLSGAEFGGSGLRYGWDYIYPSTKTIEYYAAKGVDTIRLPVKWERLQHTLGGPLEQAEVGRIQAVLDAAETNGMKVVLDIHNYGAYNGGLIGTAGVPVSAFTDLWSRLAGELKSYPAIAGYGLMNEPVGFSDKQTWPSAAQAAIDAIRAVDSETAIYVMGRNWGSAMNWIKDNDDLKYLVDPANNLVFEAHQYFDRWTSGTYQGSYDSEGAYPMVGVDRVQPFIKWLEDNNLKGFIGEYAVPDSDPRWLVVMDNFLAELAEHGVGSAYWGGGPWWGNYPLSIEPEGGLDSVQMNVLKKNIDAYKAYQDSLVETAADEAAVNLLSCSVHHDEVTGLSGFRNIAHGEFGHDRITGQELTDELWGGVGNDTLTGAGGDDLLYGENGEDRLHGGDGHDVLDAGNGEDIAYGGDGNDTILGGQGRDMLYGDGGDDTIDSGLDADTVYGGAGEDVILGGAGNDWLYGDDGDDYIEGNDGMDNLLGGAGNDYLVGGEGIDTMRGGDGDDRLDGGTMNDRMYGENGNDSLYGGADSDIMYGGDGDDFLSGDEGGDYLSGGSGNDRLFGGAGYDKLYGDEGDDILYSGEGADAMTGGAGADIFVFMSATAFLGIDKIEDFKTAEGDRIDLSDLLQAYDPLTHAITDFVRITGRGSEGVLSVDVDGGANGFVQIASIKGGSGLTDEQALVDSGHLIV